MLYKDLSDKNLVSENDVTCVFIASHQCSDDVWLAVARYSGITRQMLKHVHTRIEDVQRKIQQLLPSNAILVGHSLNCDLDALQVSVLLFIFVFVLFNSTYTVYSTIMCKCCAGLLAL